MSPTTNTNTESSAKLPDDSSAVITASTSTNQSHSLSDANFDPTSIVSVATFLRTKLILDADANTNIDFKNMEMNTSEYSSSCNHSISLFFSILSNHPQLSFLSVPTPDPQSGTTEPALILLTRGSKTQAKYEILNSAFLAVAMKRKMKGYGHINLNDR